MATVLGNAFGQLMDLALSGTSSPNFRVGYPSFDHKPSIVICYCVLTRPGEQHFALLVEGSQGESARETWIKWHVLEIPYLLRERLLATLAAVR